MPQQIRDKEMNETNTFVLCLHCHCTPCLLCTLISRSQEKDGSRWYSKQVDPEHHVPILNDTQRGTRHNEALWSRPAPPDHTQRGTESDNTKNSTEQRHEFSLLTVLTTWSKNPLAKTIYLRKTTEPLCSPVPAGKLLNLAQLGTPQTAPGWIWNLPPAKRTQRHNGCSSIRGAQDKASTAAAISAGVVPKNSAERNRTPRLRGLVSEPTVYVYY